MHEKYQITLKHPMTPCKVSVHLYGALHVKSQCSKHSTKTGKIKKNYKSSETLIKPLETRMFAVMETKKNS